REHEHCGPNVIQVKYQITLLDKDGSVLEDKFHWENGFQRENSVFFYVRKRQEKVSVSEGKCFLPDDTLMVQCKIWKKDEEPIVSELFSARTVFKVQRRSFVWRIDKFSTLKPDLRSKFMVSIIDSKGRKVNCGNQEYLDGNLKKGILFPLSFSMLMNEKSIYLPNEALSLDCEYAFSFVTSSNECARCGNISSLVTEEAVQTKKEIKVEKDKSESTSVLLNDLKSMYNNSILCDVELRTSSQTFQAHKAILSARSSVFRRMFSSDMKEKNSGHVDITDLEEETVHRMLTYLYTDSLGDLQMESASKLYTAADKYNIPSLNRRCSSFLKDNLYPSTACEVLVVADMHQDHDLKSAVQDYILNHDKEVFDTQEWKHFMATKLKLAADVMYQKVSQARV
ncbi:Speckle-type POZ protein, partial [Araneus ventricosus]